MKLKTLLGVGFAVALAWGCATEESVDDPAATHFIKFYGRDGDQIGRDLVVLPDGTMVLFGTSRATDASVLGSQWYVTRVDSKGVILWEQEFGGPSDEEARDIEMTSGGNLVLVGNIRMALDDRNVMIMTLNPATGQPIASAVHAVTDSLGAPSLGDEDVASVTETSDGFLIAGSTTYVRDKGSAGTVAGQTDSRDALQLRVKQDLTIYSSTWTQTIGKFSDDYSVKIFPGSPSATGAFYAFGATNDRPTNGYVFLEYNFWMVALESDGDGVVSTYSANSPGNKRASSVCKTPAGYFIAGLLEAGTSPQEPYIMEVGLPDVSNGFGVSREKNLSITLGTGLSGATSVTTSVNGGFLILTEENGFNANQNWMLTRIDNNGTLAWTKPIVFGGEGLDEIGAIQELSDGRIVIIGTMRTGRPDVGEFKMTLVKVNKDGKFEK